MSMSSCKAIIIITLICAIVVCAENPGSYAKLNITSFTSSNSPNFVTFPLSNEHFALIWQSPRKLDLFIQVFKPDFLVGYTNATDALTVQASCNLERTTTNLPWNKFASISRNGVDYIAFISTPPIIISWNGKTLQAKLLPTIEEESLSVVSPNELDVDFKFGSYISSNRTYFIRSISLEGIITSQQSYPIPTSLLNPQLGCGFIFQYTYDTLSVFHLNGSRIYSSQFPTKIISISLKGCQITWTAYGSDSDRGMYYIRQLGMNKDYSPATSLLTSFSCMSSLRFELKDQYLTFLCSSDYFAFFQEANGWNGFGFRQEFRMDSPLITRVTQFTSGIIQCSQSCILFLYDCIRLNDQDVKVAGQISGLANAPPYFKLRGSYELWVHNLRFISELKWDMVQNPIALISINMSGYNLIGPFPISQGYSSLKYIDLSNNQLTGDVSVIDFNLNYYRNRLLLLNIANNSLTGCPPITSSYTACFAQHNMMAGPYDSCLNATSCNWEYQHYVIKSLEPARPSPPWYLTPFNWPDRVYDAAVTYWKDMLVFAGGRHLWNQGLSSVTYFNTSNGWSTLGQLYQERKMSSIVTLGPYLIVAGGYSNTGKSVIVDIYNIANNSWSLTHFETARAEHSAVVVDDEVWFGPTYSESGNIEVFNPSQNKWRTIEENVSGKMIATPYAVVTSSLIYNRDRNKWTKSEGATSKLSVAHGSKVLLTAANGKLGLYDTYSGLWEYPDFPVGLAARTSSVVSSENCLLFLTFNSTSPVPDISMIVFNLTSNSWSSLSIPTASEPEGTLIATEKRQVWIVGAGSQLTAFTWKGFRPATKPPIIGYTPNTPAAAVQPLSAPLSSVNPVAALTPDTPVASPMTALVPKSNPPGDLTTDSTPLWPIFLVLAIVLLVGVVAGYFWFKKRRAKLVSEDEVSLLDNQDFASLQIDKEDVSNPGDIPFGEIKIGEKLGEGSYGDIFKAVWHGQKVVVKMLKSKHLDQSILIEEAKTLISLRHKHIVLSMGLSKNDETDEAMLVMEYMKNGSLENLLFNEKIKLTREEITRLALDVAKGLNYLHSLNPKIIHRDLKGANVLLYHNKKRAKISDFGTARLLNTSSAASTVIGTFGFIAPEVLQQASYNEKADIYSFGVLLFEMISNTHLAVIFEEEKRIEKISDAVADPDFKQLIINCCRTDPIERPSIRRCIEILKQIKTK